MFKKIVRIGLSLAVALGLTVPLLNTGLAQEKGTDQKRKKRTDKDKGKGKVDKRKADEHKTQ